MKKRKEIPSGQAKLRTIASEALVERVLKLHFFELHSYVLAYNSSKSLYFDDYDS